MVIKNWLFRKYKHVISYVEPIILQQPLSTDVPIGNNYTFIIKLKGSPVLTYQWYKNSTLIPAASTNTLSLSSLNRTDSGAYYCEVGNHKFTYNSNIANLNVIAPPVITAQPLSYTIQKGSQISLNMTVSGDAPITFSWYKDNNLTNATATNYYINNAIISDTGYYYAIAKNSVGSVSSDTVFLSVFA